MPKWVQVDGEVLLEETAHKIHQHQEEPQDEPEQTAWRQQKSEELLDDDGNA